MHETYTMNLDSPPTARDTEPVDEHSVHASNPRDPKNWLTPEEAARWIPGASARSVRDWCADGLMPGAIRLPSGRYWVPWTAVVAILGFDPRTHEALPADEQPPQDDPLPGLEE